MERGGEDTEFADRAQSNQLERQPWRAPEAEDLGGQRSGTNQKRFWKGSKGPLQVVWPRDPCHEQTGTLDLSGCTAVHRRCGSRAEPADQICTTKQRTVQSPQGRAEALLPSVGSDRETPQQRQGMENGAKTNASGLAPPHLQSHVAVCALRRQVDCPPQAEG
eukprot:scaffold481_cov122-Isochrysis_galbana.AAC.2